MFLVSLITLTISNSRAQMQYLPDTSIKVFAYGQQQNLAWCGGMNNSQFAMADLNHDGIQDLVIFQPWGSLMTFINKGVAGNPYYVYAPEYALKFPPLIHYLVMADYNRDGITDLFHQGNYGVAVYKGYYNTDNQLCFTFFKDLFYNDPSIPGGHVDAIVTPGDIPAIVDIDGDGDLDFLSYNLAGGSVTYYRNMQIELGLPSESIYFEMADYCWGKFGDSSGQLRLNYYIGGDHLGRSLCLLDYDIDGDIDVLKGDIFSNRLTFLKNGRIPYNPSGADSMASYDSAWQSGGTVVNVNSFPAAYNIDVDQYGKKDLIVTPEQHSRSRFCQFSKFLLL